MALPESSLSTVCASVAQFVKDGVNATANHINVTMGAPADVPQHHPHHRLNLFFYRFESSAFDTDVHPLDPWRIRMFCLITAFGIDDDDVLAGENELRILGEVMRIFHEKPVLDPVTVNGATVRLQVIFSTVPAEQLNQVWSTQGDTAYRPSVFYEMALTPIMPSERRPPALLVGSIGQETRSRMASRFAPFDGTVAAPPVQPAEVDIDDPQWIPALCWVIDGECQRSLAVKSGTGFTPAVWVAGDTADTVELVWQVWTKDGWTTQGSPLTVTPFSTGLDPDHVPSAIPGTFPEELTLPFAIPDHANATQGLLYAQRTVTPVPDQPPVTLRSDPLLLSLYQE